MAKTKAQLGKMEAQMKQWGAKLDEFVVKAGEVGAEAKGDYQYLVDDLKAKYQIAQAKLDEINAAGSEKWEALKVGVDGAWGELEAAFKKMTN